jgi:phage gpG-like protein
VGLSFLKGFEMILFDAKDFDVIAKKLGGDPKLSKSLVPYFKQAVTDFVENAQDEAPYHKGKLSHSIASDFGNDLTAKVGTNNESVPYAKYVYDGTREHIIKPKSAKSLRFVGMGGNFVFAKSVKIPARKPNKYLDKTWDKHEKEYTEMIEHGVETIIQEDLTP